MKYVRTLLIGLTVLLTLGVKAQDKELGVLLGAAQYQGDLSYRQLTLNATKPGFGAFARYYFNPRIDIKGQLAYGWIDGDDKNYPDVENNERKYRNLSFRSHIVELSGVAELNIMPFISNSRRYRFAPYVFGGLAVFHFNPRTQYNGQWVDLQPLGTEGQTLNGDHRYSRIQFSIPYGLGLKYSLGNFWNIGIEVGQRKTFTDYLDDVSSNYPNRDEMIAAGNPTGAALSDRSWELAGSIPANKIKNRAGIQRGDPKQLDMYEYAGVTISKTIRRFSCSGF